MKHTLYMTKVTEHEWGSGCVVSTRPDGVAFCENEEQLLKYFSLLSEDSFASSTPTHHCYVTIVDPVLVEVDNNCIHFYNYKTANTTHKVLWLRGESLTAFMKGVTK